MNTVMQFSQWADTAHVIHMLTQMMGKVKLGRMESQPEWNHALLSPTSSGFTTGLIPQGETSFEIVLDIEASTVQARCTSGLAAGFPIREGRSISGYYADFLKILEHIGHAITLNPAPQEVANTTPFDRQTQPLAYDINSARSYFEACIFAHNALLTFAAPIRGKKILPSLFWGTFDMTTVIFAGVDRPYGGKGLIERVAFDEQFVEFGFWPGDTNVEDPSFFVLPYPFLEKDLTGSRVSPKEAFYSMEKKEFFLPLKDVLRYDNPQEVVLNFCRDTFDIVAREEHWPNLDWFTKPLLC